jgi:hypothetical protein
LLPLAIAIARATGRGGGGEDLVVGTRIRDKSLLLASLAQLGIKYRTRGRVLYAQQGDLIFALLREADDLYHCHFSSDLDEATAETVVADLERTYGKLVQREVYDRLQEQAPQHGMEIEAESVDDDDSIVLTVTVSG